MRIIALFFFVFILVGTAHSRYSQEGIPPGFIAMLINPDAAPTREDFVTKAVRQFQHQNLLFFSKPSYDAWNAQYYRLMGTRKNLTALDIFETLGVSARGILMGPYLGYIPVASADLTGIVSVAGGSLGIRRQPAKPEEEHILARELLNMGRFAELNGSLHIEIENLHQQYLRSISLYEKQHIQMCALFLLAGANHDLAYDDNWYWKDINYTSAGIKISTYITNQSIFPDFIALTGGDRKVIDEIQQEADLIMQDALSDGVDGFNAFYYLGQTLDKICAYLTNGFKPRHIQELFHFIENENVSDDLKRNSKFIKLYRIISKSSPLPGLIEYFGPDPRQDQILQDSIRHIQGQLSTAFTLTGDLTPDFAPLDALNEFLLSLQESNTNFGISRLLKFLRNNPVATINPRLLALMGQSFNYVQTYYFRLFDPAQLAEVAATLGVPLVDKINAADLINPDQHERNLMFGIVYSDKILPKYRLFFEGIVNVYASSLKNVELKNLARQAILNLKDLGQSEIDLIMASIPPIRGKEAHTIPFDHMLRGEKISVLDTLVQVEEAVRAEKAARLLAAQQAAERLKANMWDIPAFDKTPPARFEMPDVLQTQEQEILRFFMNYVRPKLIHLLTTKKITTHVFNGVLRAYSMAILGSALAEGYAEIAHDDITSASGELIRSFLNGGRSFVNALSTIPLNMVLAKDAFAPYGAFYDDGSPILLPLAANMQNFTTYMGLHLNFIEQDKAFKDLLRTSKAAAAERLRELVRQNIMQLPLLLNTTFARLLDLDTRAGADATVGLWAQFSASCDSTLCYDGSIDEISAAAGIVAGRIDEIEARLAAPPVAVATPPLHVLYKKITPDIDLQETSGIEKDLPGFKADGTVPGFSEKLDAFFDPDGSFSYPLPNFRGKTLANIGISPEIINAIYDKLGRQPGGNCMFTDEEILEALYWRDSGGINPLPGDIKARYGID